VGGGLFTLALSFFLFLPGMLAAGLAGSEGRIYGESFVNLRSGPDVSHPSKEILREGQEVRVEKEDGSWYLVSLPDGRRGYVHRSLVRITEGAKLPQEVEKNATPPSEDRRENLPQAPSARPAAQIPKGQPLPIIKVLDGKEWEVLGWFGVALCIFILGWICGGHYYLRRDRIKKTKLRF